MYYNDFGIKRSYMIFEGILYLIKNMRLHNVDILEKFLKD